MKRGVVYWDEELSMNGKVVLEDEVLTAKAPAAAATTAPRLLADARLKTASCNDPCTFTVIAIYSSPILSVSVRAPVHLFPRFARRSITARSARHRVHVPVRRGLMLKIHPTAADADASLTLHAATVTTLLTVSSYGTVRQFEVRVALSAFTVRVDFPKLMSANPNVLPDKQRCLVSFRRCRHRLCTPPTPARQKPPPRPAAARADAQPSRIAGGDASSVDVTRYVV